MSLGNSYEDRILDSMIGSTQLTASNTLWIGLSTGTIADDASGLAEPSGNGYARVATVNSSNAWSASASGVKRNAAAITFPTATGSWGNVTDFAIWAAATSTGVGAMIAYGTLGTAKNITNGDAPSFGVGSLALSLD